MLKPNSLNTSSDTYKVTRATPELLQAACDVVNNAENNVAGVHEGVSYFLLSARSFRLLKGALLKAGCVDE